MEGFRTHNTERVKKLWRRSMKEVPWPADIQYTLAGSRIRNPDLVAYHKGRREWRFCEVKSWNDRVNPGQLTGLAVIHLLTGAPVAIVRPVPKGHTPKGRKIVTVNLPYHTGTNLSWAIR